MGGLFSQTPPPRRKDHFVSFENASIFSRARYDGDAISRSYSTNFDQWSQQNYYNSVRQPTTTAYSQMSTRIPPKSYENSVPDVQQSSLLFRPKINEIPRKNYENSVPGVQRQHAFHQERTGVPPVLVKPNPNILNCWQSYPINKLSLSFSTLPEDHPDYINIKSRIKSNNIQIDKIDKVNNIFLQKAFELKKEEKQSIFRNVEERILFHGTKHSNVSKICKYNFDWRLRGSNTGHRYGQGISFSPLATYACNYSDNDRVDKVMIVAKVLIGLSWIIWNLSGDSSMVLPPSGYDTTQKGGDGSVIVKYEDSEYYPCYVVYYHLRGYRTSYRGRGQRQRRGLGRQAI